MSKKLKIITIASEIAPFAKTGGLADVARSLSKALVRQGHEVVAIMPFYEQVIDKDKHKLKLVHKNVKIYLGGQAVATVNYWQGYLMDNLPLYFVEHKKYFGQKKTLYGSDKENSRFLLFDAAALNLILLLQLKPDIIHCHDWQTGLIPQLIKTDFSYAKDLKNARTVFTIHNLVFQLGHNWWEVPLAKKDYGKKKLPGLHSPELENINFAKRAIMQADIINTVSEQYKIEIMTKNFGQDLHQILRRRADRLFGIVNGIDYNEYNPEKDSSLFKNYNYTSVQNKAANKIHLQKKVGLPLDDDAPLLALTSRVVFQKGFALFFKILAALLKLEVQVLILGDGDKQYITQLKKAGKTHPHKIVWLPFKDNAGLETMVYAGADLFLLPSHHEPCGINQLIAMRYGCIPVVRSVGGLYDTVTNYNPKTNRGNGFSFSSFNEWSLFATIIRALENYRHQNTWHGLVSRAMRQSNSWEIPAHKYVSLYRLALKQKTL